MNKQTVHAGIDAGRGQRFPEVQVHRSAAAQQAMLDIELGNINKAFMVLAEGNNRR